MWRGSLPGEHGVGLCCMHLEKALYLKDSPYTHLSDDQLRPISTSFMADLIVKLSSVTVDTLE